MLSNADRTRDDEVSEINRLAGLALAAMTMEAPGFYARLTRNASLVLSGEPVADLNTLFIGPEPDPERFLVEAMAEVRKRRLPLHAALTVHVADALQSSASGLGLQEIGKLPLMVLRATAPLELSGTCEVEQALDEQTIQSAGDLQALAFDYPRASVARAIDTSMKASANLETFVGRSRGQATSTVTVTRSGSSAGIWSMATAPEKQRSGMGRAMLTRVLELYRQRGVSRFYLVASEAGRPLYDGIGFTTIGEYAAWEFQARPQ